MTNTATASAVTPSLLRRILIVMAQTMLPVFIWGAPAVGKSAIVRQVADAIFNPDGALKVSEYFRDVRAMLLDPVDLRGIPSIVNGMTVWNPPAFLPTSGSGILFIDELSQCDPSVQSALLQLILDRQLGEYYLPKGWYIIAAGNRISDGTFSKKLSKALGSRFATHLDLEVGLVDWMDWAASNGINHKVMAFLRLCPDLLHKFDPKAEGNSFPAPRTWAFVSQTIDNLDPDMMHPVLSGSLGSGVATQFIGFLRLYDDLPNMEDIFTDPDSVALPSEPSTRYALCGALAQKTVSAVASNVFKYMKRMPVEMQVVWLRDAIRVNDEVTRTKEFTEWAVANGDLLS